MNSCIEAMMREHELIVQVLASLHALGARIEAGEPVDRSDVLQFGRFFQEFADQCHHGKEEDRLFVKMVEVGFPQESGPIAVMLAEHNAGREEVMGLLAIGRGSGALIEAERDAVVSYAARFVPLLYGHIQKENNILYPMAQNAIPPEEFARLDSACAAFDQEVAGVLNLAELRALASDLMQRYPGSLNNLAGYGGCGARRC